MLSFAYAQDEGEYLFEAKISAQLVKVVACVKTPAADAAML
jgi:hypothetical protein